MLQDFTFQKSVIDWFLQLIESFRICCTDWKGNKKENYFLIH